MYHIKLSDYPTHQEAFANIPPGVSLLNLAENDLSGKTAEELVQIVTAIPPGISSLNLSFNNLHEKTDEELGKIFVNILPSVS